MYKFPENPVLGQEYTEGQKAWKWNGFAWNLTAITNTQVEIAKAAAVTATASANVAGQKAVDATAAASSASGFADAARASADLALQAIDDVIATVPTDNSQLTNGAGYITSLTAPVRSINDKTGAVVISKSDLGLSNVDNTSDMNKPISTATQAALLDVYGSIPTNTNQLTNGAGFITQANVTKAAVGLANVNNTSDADKPVSTAQAAAIATKEPSIPAGAATDYWTGAKSFAPFGTAVLNTPLTGYAVVDVATTAADTVLTAIGKVQGQVNAREVAWKKNAANGYVGLTANRRIQVPNPAGNVISEITNTNSVYRAYALPDKPGIFAMMDDVATPTVNSINAGQLAGFRNVVINGCMRVAQRGNSIITPGYKSLDRWFINCAGAELSTTQVSGENFMSPGFVTVQSLIGQVGNTDSNIEQRIESLQTRHMAGKLVTLSYWLFQNTGANKTIQTAMNCPTNSVDNFSGPNTSGPVLPPTVIPPNVWTKVTLSGVLPDQAKNGVRIVLCSGIGPVVANQSYSIGNVQLELGGIATPFEQRPLALETILCRRYFQRVKAQLAGYTLLDCTNEIITQLPVPMRAIPTVTTVANTLITTGCKNVAIIPVSDSAYSLTSAGLGAQGFIAGLTSDLSAEL